MRGNSPVRFGKRPTEKDPNHGHLAGGLFHSAGGCAEKDLSCRQLAARPTHPRPPRTRPPWTTTRPASTRPGTGTSPWPWPTTPGLPSPPPGRPDRHPAAGPATAAGPERGPPACGQPPGPAPIRGNRLITGSDGMALTCLSVNEIRRMHAALCRPAPPPRPKQHRDPWRPPPPARPLPALVAVAPPPAGHRPPMPLPAATQPRSLLMPPY
jgi:hypothetical protein